MITRSNTFVLASRKNAAEENLLPPAAEKPEEPRDSPVFQDFKFVFGKRGTGKISPDFPFRLLGCGRSLPAI